MTGHLIVIAGPSGVGKGTVLKGVFHKSSNLAYSISITTRPKRSGEIEGESYFFRSREQFEAMIAENKMLEWAEFVGNYYGTPKDYVETELAKGKDVILEIELEGAKQIKRSKPDGLFIFVKPPSLDSLRRRLQERSTEAPAKIEKRLARASQELEEADWFDYYITNEDGKIAETVDQIVEIINSTRSHHSHQSIN